MFSTEPSADFEERAGIFGLETEYAVLYFPDDPSAGSHPPFGLLQDLIFSSLLARRKAAVSGGLKGGYFVQNGGLIHLEIFLRDQSDTPILEAATPECRSPWDLLVYSRAFDHLLDEVGVDVTTELRETHGYQGRLAFGKNNQDQRHIGFGCHENYLIHHESSGLDRFFYLLCMPLILVCLVPAILFLVATLLVVAVALVTAKFVPPLGRFARSLWIWLFGQVWPLRSVPAVYYLFANLLLFPAIWTYATLLKRLAFRPFTRDLTSFLVSRQILTGSGTLNFRKRCYEISQRPELTGSMGDIVMFGKRKTIFDLKGLLYDPFAFFKATKKLTVTLGDSNLSDVPLLLKTGATALILEMIEAGESFEELRLKRPVAAFRQISLGGPWKQIPLEDGSRRTALEIQREYLTRARDFFTGRPQGGRLRPAEILDLWEETLDRLADRRHGLADTLDWAAKKSLLDAAVLAHSDWKVFFAWGHLFFECGPRAVRDATCLDDLLKRGFFWRRRALGRHARDSGLREEDFEAQRDLYFQARKIDLRYHEIGGGDGYQRMLEGKGHIQRLTVDDDVERASREPPRDTRARVRGYYIGLSPVPDAMQVNWHEIELQSPMRHITLPDPFYFRLPGD